MPAARQQQQQQQQQPACAACKHQRRRCTAECPLARYFPHDRPDLFRSAHRLFGVSNILKTLRRAGPDRARRDDAMRGLAYEAAAWDAYPAGGCLPAIVALESQLRQEHGILRCLHAQIRHHRRRLQTSPPLSLPPPTADVPPAPTEGSNMHYLDEHKYVPASSGLYGNDNGDDGVVAAPPLPWTMQPQYYEGAIADMGGAVAQEENHQYQLLFDHTATAGGHQHEYDEISPFLELENIHADDHHDRTPPDESNSANSWKKKEIKPSTKMELN